MGTEYFQLNDPATSAKMNRTVVSGTAASPGATTFIWYGRVLYNGASWEVSTSFGSAGIETSMLSWNGTDDRLDIDFTSALDFIEAPIIVATEVDTDAAYKVKTDVSESASEFTGHLGFYDEANGNPVTSEDTNMNASIIIIGKYT